MDEFTTIMGDGLRDTPQAIANLLIGWP